MDMVAIFMVSAKLVTPGLFLKNIFLNKNHDVIISVHDVTNKILPRDSNYIVDVVCDQILVSLTFL